MTKERVEIRKKRKYPVETKNRIYEENSRPERDGRVGRDRIHL